jgi:hypothetical protein
LITLYTRWAHYDSKVSTLKTIMIHIRLSQAHYRLLKALSEKTGLDRTNVIRLAVSRLAESEGILPPPGSQRH